jgi:hypothetical protein
MPKLTVDFSIPLNILARDDGTKEALVAIAYFRGEGGSFAGPARDALASFVRSFRSGLPEADAKRYDEILATVRETEAQRRAINSDTPRKRRR